MISLRGFETKIESKFLDQLAIESTEFDRLFGGNLISDVVVIGNDLYMEDGASVGVILQAKSSKALFGRLSSRRIKFAKTHAADDRTEIEELTVLGQPVQFLKTPDNRFRSFYVVMGDGHLVTSSLSLTKRFIEAYQGKGSMANSREFQFARREMPLDRDDTVFMFLPTRFFQRLLGPHYQIELGRRNRSIADIQILEMAVLAARAEGMQRIDSNALIAAGFLPERFGQRPDGSQLTRVGNDWVDSIRGRRGFFTPIPDLKMNGATNAEVSSFEDKRHFYADKLPGLDPMFIAIKRFEHKNNIERVVFDGRIAPFGQTKYGWLVSRLGTPSREYVAGSPNDIIRFSANLKGGVINNRIPPHQIFGAIQDEADAGADLKPNSLFKLLDMFKTAPGYVGSWPPAGYLNWLPSLGRQPDEHGYTQSKILGLWRLNWDYYSIVAFNRDRLEHLKPAIHVETAEHAAHVRIHVGDLANSNLKGWANAQNYRRSWQTSIANTRLLNMLVQQFHLDPVIARDVAEHLLDVVLVCSLDGEYEMVATPSGRLVWQSTKWPSFFSPTMPNGYTAPLLKWFRGLQLEVVNAETQFVVHGYIDIEREPSSKLPSFDLFKGFSDLLSGGKKNPKDSKESKNGQKKK